MMTNRKYERFGRKRRSALTGLETAIILISFIIVASVFAFTIMNLGFQTSQKAGAVIKQGYNQAASSLQMSGSLVASGDTTNHKLVWANFTVQLTAGQAPVDLAVGKLIVSYSSADKSLVNVYANSSAGVEITEVKGTGQYGNTLLNPGETFLVSVHLAGSTINDNIGPYGSFTVELKPASGSVLTVTGTAPGDIAATMDLSNV